MEHVCKDDLAYCRLLLHVFFHQLDQKLIDKFLNVRGRVAQVLRDHKADDPLERIRVTNDYVLRLCIVANELSQDDDDIIVDLNGKVHVTDTRTVQNLQQRPHSLLIFRLSDLLRELFLISRVGDEDLDKAQHIQ